MVSDRAFAGGLGVLAVACLASAGYLFDHHEPLAVAGVVAGVVVAGIGLLTAAGYGIDGGSPEADALGVVMVFGTVAGFGLVVTTLLLVAEALLVA